MYIFFMYICLFRLNFADWLYLRIELLRRIKINALQRSLLLVSRDMSLNIFSSSNKKTCKYFSFFVSVRNLFYEVV